MKRLLAIIAALALTGCAQQPICDRDGQEWFKFGTQEDTCDVRRPGSNTVEPRDGEDSDESPRSGPIPDGDLPSDEDNPDVPDDGVDETPGDGEGGDDTGDGGEGDSTDETNDDSKGRTGDNSDANGKGGNKHDRDDFTHGGTEVAEDKKGV